MLVLYGLAMLWITAYNLSQLALTVFAGSRVRDRAACLNHIGTIVPDGMSSDGPTPPPIKSTGTCGVTPGILVQLPIYNEQYVVEQLLDAVERLDYPNVAIQVLDDSTDATGDIIKRRLLSWQGADIEHIVRHNRSGYKAGALAKGLELSDAPYVAIFDADFVPDPDFLTKMMANFSPEIGMVQAQWSHLNEPHNWLTRLQTLGLAGHFGIEQRGRNGQGLFINFNGTAGVWRRACIEDAGGWSADALTEDLDLSYRAQLAGWQFKYVPEISCPALLPADIEAFSTQQFRWNKGAAECARKLLFGLWASGASLKQKVFGSFHLTNSSGFLLMLLVSVLNFPLNATGAFAGIFGHANTLFSINWLIVFYFCFQAERHLSLNKMLVKFLKFTCFLSGLSLQNAVGVAEGWLGIKSPFVRTPKYLSGSAYRDRRVSLLFVLEILFMGLMISYLYGAISLALWKTAIYYAFLSTGYIWVVSSRIAYLRKLP